MRLLWIQQCKHLRLSGFKHVDKVTCCDYWIFYINLSLKQDTAWHISRWPLRNCFISWSENSVTEISIILHHITIYSPLQTRALHQHTQPFHKPLKSVFTGRLKTPVCSLPSRLRSPLALLLFLHRRLSSRTGGWEKGTRLRGGHLLWQAREVWRAGSIRLLWCCFFFENANTLSTSLVHSFISLIYSFISHIAEGA